MTNHMSNTELQKYVDIAVDKAKLATLEKRQDVQEKATADLVERIYAKLNSIQRDVASLQREVVTAEAKMEVCRMGVKADLHQEIEDAYVNKAKYDAFVDTVKRSFSSIRDSDSKSLIKIVSVAQLLNFGAMAVFYFAVIAEKLVA